MAGSGGGPLAGAFVLPFALAGGGPLAGAFVLPFAQPAIDPLRVPSSSSSSHQKRPLRVPSVPMTMLQEKGHARHFQKQHRSF